MEHKKKTESVVNSLRIKKEFYCVLYNYIVEMYSRPTYYIHTLDTEIESKDVWSCFETMREILEAKINEMNEHIKDLDKSVKNLEHKFVDET